MNYHINLVEGLKWFHPNLNRHQAEAILMQNGLIGAYLLRDKSNSTDSSGNYSLSCRCANSVKHFEISYDGVHWTFGMGKFTNIADFVSHFKKTPLIGGDSGVLTLLKYPYPREVDEPPCYESVRVHAEWGDCTLGDNKPQSINSKEGYLTKQGFHVKNWKARWFVLCKNELVYYKIKGDSLPLKKLDLSKCTGIEEDETCGKPHAMRIIMPTRTFYVFASNAGEIEEWLTILKWKINNLNSAI